ncbi:MAG: hypothetical protein COB09_03265 [Thalassobium sp.]|uniref:Uncharacterized protein n=1 Tax=Thalassolituus pacificus TaxID=2975440 RepID=A0A9X2WG60_9GAMM|nr:hypothetical protein [Thalassolituus pacificus]MCT7359827.1 hypothetical protein [Thalassolituus pacificus]PHS66491.1 MAG: hypothetical protein COB09_03265 [Thalassobium sp.]
MHGLQSGILVLTLLLPLAACVGGGKATKSSALDEGVAPGQLNQTLDHLSLTPVPLYGMPELALGAVWQSGSEPMLQVCDQHRRPLDAGKPLVLYIDGEHEILSLQRSDSQSVFHCSYFASSAEQLDRIASSQTVMLRIYFNGEAVEQRISGTMSDYFSRPKMLGPQQRLKRFVDALQHLNLSSALVDG